MTISLNANLQDYQRLARRKPTYESHHSRRKGSTFSGDRASAFICGRLHVSIAVRDFDGVGGHYVLRASLVCRECGTRG
jgi:hypothetical protein